MTAGETITRGRAAFAAHRWSEAHASLAAADGHAPLEDPEDLERLATAAFLVGRDATSIEARTRAYNVYLERREHVRAAQCAFWLAFVIIDDPRQQALAGGWLARAGRLLEGSSEDCVGRGFLLCAAAFRKMGERDFEGAGAVFGRAADIGTRRRDPDLTALARHGLGRSLLRLGRSTEGFAVLDEVMVGVTCGEVGPLVAGVVYCSVISACHERFDLNRAHEWTMALTRWCDAYPDMVPFRGPCLVRRSELMQLRGEWQAATREAERACERLTDAPSHPDSAAAHYQRAELYRLQGAFEQADDHYKRAHDAGPQPLPGLARLRMAQGQTEAAASAIRRAVEQTRNSGARVRADVLAACVEIMLDQQDLVGAEDAAAELSRLTNELDASFLQATAAQASGAVALARGKHTIAVARLRQGCEIWRALDAPYHAARTRALLGLAYRAMGDEEGARMELDSAQETFDRLGAVPDGARVAALLAPETPIPASGLTGREVEVLRLVASGKTNRAIAAELDISEKTVARHIANIFVKLDLSSRTAATAYAYRHHMV